MTTEYATIALDLGPRGWREVWCEMITNADGSYSYRTEQPSQKRWVNILNGVDEETGLSRLENGEYVWDCTA